MSKEDTFAEPISQEKPLLSADSNQHSLVEGKTVLFSCEHIIFCLDRSDSMSGHKLQTLKKCFRGFIERRLGSESADKDQLAVVLFPGENEYDPQTIKSLISLAPAALSMADTFDDVRSTGDTPMGEALQCSGEILAETQSGLARIVIMTDGQPQGGMSRPKVLQVATTLFEEYGITIDVVGIVDPGHIYHHIDEAFLKELAECGHGSFQIISSFEDFSHYLNQVEEERRNLIGKGVLLLPGS